jgi:hypothetical protein
MSPSEIQTFGLISIAITTICVIGIYVMIIRQDWKLAYTLLAIITANVIGIITVMYLDLWMKGVL